MCWGHWLSEKEQELAWCYLSVSSVDAMWPAASHTCRHAFPSMRDYSPLEPKQTLPPLSHFCQALSLQEKSLIAHPPTIGSYQALIYVRHISHIEQPSSRNYHGAFRHSFLLRESLLSQLKLALKLHLQYIKLSQKVFPHSTIIGLNPWTIGGLLW